MIPKSVLSAYHKAGVTSLIRLNASKTPIEKDWTRWAYGELDTERAMELEAHSGNLGFAIPDGLVVIDCDSQDDTAKMKQWLDGQRFVYWHQLTAKGAHYVLRNGNGIKNSVKTRYNDMSFDLRGHGGQIVVEPSIHSTGHHYKWIVAPWDVPKDQLSVLPSFKKMPVAQPTSSVVTQVTIQEGNRNATLFKMASSLRGQGWDEQQITHFLQVQNTGYCQPPLPDIEVKNIAESVSKFEQGAALTAPSISNKTERPLTINTHDALGRLQRYLTLAHQLKRYGQSREIAQSTLIGCGYKEDGSYIQKAIDIVYSDVPTADARESQIHTPGRSLEEYRSFVMQRGQDHKPELPTGFPKLDQCLWGIRRGEVITIGARTGVGKTSFIVSAVYNLCELGKKVLFISTETTYLGIYNRFVAIATGIPTFSLDSGQLTAKERDYFDEFLTVFNEYQLSVYDMPEPSLIEITEAIKQHRPDVVVVDHIQHTAVSTDNRYGELSKFVKGLKNIAMKYDCGMIIASQLNRLAVNDIPTLAHLKECGTIEEESTAVLLLYKSNDSPESPQDQIFCIIGKNRGPKGVIPFTLNRLCTKFEENL